MSHEEEHPIDRRDEVAEYRIFGPPGTGKTTHLARQIERGAEKHGASTIMVTSFSRAAAAELVSRNLPLAKEQIGTLHAHCYRALGHPPIADARIDEWNKDRPESKLEADDESPLDEGYAEAMSRSGTANYYLKEANRLRNLRRPVDTWEDPCVVRFHQDWTEWKDSNGLVDFTDMLEIALRDFRYAPGMPKLIFADEAQDFTPLQLAVVRQWGNHGEYFVVCGDDDQTIFDFTGASPFAFIRPEIAASHKIVLAQSFRVPQAVHQLATAWIQGVHVREPKEYRPTAQPGKVVFASGGGLAYQGATHQKPKAILDSMERRLARGQTIMALGSCGYMLNGVVAGLRERGIPFHNPYRTRRGSWNPLAASGKRVSAADRVIALLAAHGDRGRPWTVKEFRSFAQWMESRDTFAHGVKAALEGLAGEAVVTEDMLRAWLLARPMADLEGLLEGPAVDLLNWWLERLNGDHGRLARYVCQVAAIRGTAALRERPKVIIGTIHSVKGAEADVVYLFPDLSWPGHKGWTSDSWVERDPIIRQFYVGMTRAKDTLVICGSSGSSVPISPYLMGGN